MDVCLLFYFVDIYDKVIVMIMFVDNYVFIYFCVWFNEDDVVVFNILNFVRCCFFVFYGNEYILMVVFDLVFLYWLIVVKCVV